MRRRWDGRGCFGALKGLWPEKRGLFHSGRKKEITVRFGG